MSEGIDGDIVLVGFPYDEGVVRNGGRRGAELGPCCLRRFLPKTGPLYNVEHQISIDSLRFSDYLNIQPAEETMDAAYEKLRTKLLTIFGKTQNPRTLIVGGGDDLTYYSSLACCEQATNEQKPVVILRIDSALDVDVMQADTQIHNGNHVRKLFDTGALGTEGKLVYFGVNPVKVAKAHVDFVGVQNTETYFLKEVQRGAPEETHPGVQELNCISEISARRLSDILSSLRECFVHVVFDLSAINSAWAPGVSFPSIVGGLTALESAEIGLVLGFWECVRCVAFTEYSPAVEDLRTGSLLSEVIYNFLLGEQLRRNSTTASK